MTPPPRWARIADGLCLLLLLVAFLVAASGGFRMRMGELRISLTSPGRLLLWAVALGVIRHALARQAPIYRDVPARLRTWWRLPEVRAAATATVASRAAVLFVGYMAVVTFGYYGGQPPFRLDENEAVNLQARWDTGWYLGIALGQYAYDPDLAHAQQNIVFFPALPVSMRIAGRLLGGTTGAFLLGGTLIVLFAFGGALIYLYRFAREVLGDDDERAQYVLWLVAAYPFALFYSSVYTESIFLFGAVGAFYHFTRGQLARAGLFGLLVGLTRPNGCFLSIPLALLALHPWLPRWLAGGRSDGSRPEVSSLVPQMAAAAMPGVGVLLYSAFIWQLSGHPLAWAEGHIAWGRSYQGLSILITERYDYISQSGLYGYTSELPVDLLQLLGVIFVLAAVWGVYRRFGLAYAAFILVNILPPLAAGGLLSAGRFSAVLFPAFVWFAAVTPARHRVAWIATFMAIQALNAALFYTWRSIY